MNKHDIQSRRVDESQFSWREQRMNNIISLESNSSITYTNLIGCWCVMYPLCIYSFTPLQLSH